MSLKDAVRQYAYDLGADLVGFGDVGRCRHAPPMMSPQGLYPSTRTVIVMAIHHPDACIERGGEKHPQEIGPYSVQYMMNSRLDEMSYRMATFLERQGCGAMPIVSSNIWRYNEYRDLKSVFAPDVSHIYMAVAAGLADMGFSGLAITPEYGARNRFITVLTDAEIEPDPLLPPGSVCDRCMLCRKHCPSGALSKEIDGENVLEIGPYQYRFPRKNLWRCAWGEHFDLDLDLPIPDVVDEQVILDNVRKHGIRCGEMGQCLKFCLPKNARRFDPGYSRSPMRKYPAISHEAIESRAVADRLLSGPLAGGADEVIVTSADDLRKLGIDPDAMLPGAWSALTVVVTRPPAGDDRKLRSAAQYIVDSLCYDLVRSLEGLGCRSWMTVERRADHPDPAQANPTAAIVQSIAGPAGAVLVANTVLTRKALPPQRRGGARAVADCGNAAMDLTAHLFELAHSFGADLVGVAPASRLDEMIPQLRPIFETEVLDAADKSTRFTPWEPVVTANLRRLKTPGDWLGGAKSVLVLGVRMHKEVFRWATRPPAEAVGPYAFQTYESNCIATLLGFRLIKRLQEFGFAGVMSLDVTGTDSLTANPRGPQHDLFANRFAALAAGLGCLTTSGRLATPQFGLRQRFVAIVTDAPLTASPLAPPAAPPACDSCPRHCITNCPSQAITSRRVSVSCEGRTWAFNHKDPLRCDWVKRYALMADSGFKYLGSTVDIAPPETITADALAAALKRHDPIKKYRPAVAEPCVIHCPLALV